MNEIFDNDKNENPITEDKTNADNQAHKIDSENKEDNQPDLQNLKDTQESKADNEFLHWQTGKEGDEKKAPSNAYQSNQADDENKKDEKEAQADKTEIRGTSHILNEEPNKSKKQKRTLGIGVAAIIIAISLSLVSLIVAADTAKLVGKAIDSAFDKFRLDINVGGIDPYETEVESQASDKGLSVIEQEVVVDVDKSENNADMSIAQVVSRTKETVVLITAIGYDRFGRPTSGTGSGVVITEDGYIVTNNHVIDGAAQVRVDVPGKGEFEATVIGYDRSSDIALLRINTNGLAYATLGDSDSLEMGQEVVALGYPLGGAQTVTSGLVSSLNVKVRIDGVEMSLIRTNAEINPGNSGGGLFDRSGRLIGIVNAKQVDTQIEGLGYAIPINTVVESIKK